MKAWELFICVAALLAQASYWAFPEWWDKEWRGLRATWWERAVGMVITGCAGYVLGAYAC